MLREIAKTFAVGTAMLVRIDEEKRMVDGLGSAFLCHSKGYLLTSAHTFRLTDTLGLVVHPDLNGFAPVTMSSTSIVFAKAVQYDAANDVALLKVDLPVGVPLNMFADESTIELGATVAYIGYPFSNRDLHARHVASSTLAGKVISQTGTRQFQLDASIHEGCSGGPVIDVKTKKIFGIVSGRFSPAGAQPFAMIGNVPLGQDSSISYATSIRYGLALMKEEGLHA